MPIRLCRPSRIVVHCPRSLPSQRSSSLGNAAVAAAATSLSARPSNLAAAAAEAAQTNREESVPRRRTLPLGLSPLALGIQLEKATIDIFGHNAPSSGHF